MALEVFRSLYDAKQAGFEVYDRAPTIFLVRKRDGAGSWKLAIVSLTLEPRSLPLRLENTDA